MEVSAEPRCTRTAEARGTSPPLPTNPTATPAGADHGQPGGSTRCPQSLNSLQPPEPSQTLLGSCPAKRHHPAHVLDRLARGIPHQLVSSLCNQLWPNKAAKCSKKKESCRERYASWYFAHIEPDPHRSLINANPEELNHSWTRSYR